MDLNSRFIEMANLIIKSKKKIQMELKENSAH